MSEFAHNTRECLHRAARLIWFVWYGTDVWNKRDQNNKTQEQNKNISSYLEPMQVSMCVCVYVGLCSYLLRFHLILTLVECCHRRWFLFEFASFSSTVYHLFNEAENWHENTGKLCFETNISVKMPFRSLWTEKKTNWKLQTVWAENVYRSTEH